MANVHGFSDLERGEAGTSSVPPDSLWGSLTAVFCPRFAYKSVSFGSIVLYILLFFLFHLISWATGIYYSCILYYVGALYPPDLLRFHLHRLVLPTFYHADTMHLFSNLLGTFFLCFSVEYELGSKKFLILYLGSSVYGYILSAAAKPYALGVGASAGLMGVLGYFVICILFGLQRMNNRNYAIFAVLVFLNIFIILVSPGGNFYGHFGGVLSGSLWSLMLVEARSDLTNPKRIAKIALIGFPSVCLIWFLLQRVRYESICTQS